MKRNQITGFEPLSQSKFIPLNKQKLVHVLGGKATAGGSKVITTEYTIDGDTRYQRKHIKSWSADEITANGECYTDLEYCTSDWEPS
jgi:hypothetical protein